jgi:hypothetical protein
MYDTLQKSVLRGMVPRWPIHDLAESCQKVFEGLPVPLKEYFIKIFAFKIYTTQGQKDPCLKRPKGQKFYLGSAEYQTPGNDF